MRFYEKYTAPKGSTNAYTFFVQKMQAKTVQKGDAFLQTGVFCPIWPEEEVSKVTIMRQFASGNGPMLIKCGLMDHDLEELLLWKPDDCRADMCVMNVFGVFNNIWQASRPLYNLTPSAFSIDTCPLTKDVGIMEFVKGSVTLEGYDTKILMDLPEKRQLHFISTMAGSYTACYVMGCRDRHFDNFMVKNGDTFLQIDFKRCFDRAAAGPVDAPHFSIKAEIYKALHSLKFEVERKNNAGITSTFQIDGWNLFKNLCWHALKGLRTRGVAIVKIASGMFQGLRRTKHWSSQNKMQRWLLRALDLGCTDLDAQTHLNDLIEMGVASWKKSLKNILHGINLERVTTSKAPRRPSAVYTMHSSLGDIDDTVETQENEESS